MHVNDPSDPEAASLIDSMEALGLIQHVNFPTHRHGNTLDLVFTESTKHINISNIIPGEFLSDHCLVKWQTSITRADLISKTITTRKMKEIDTEKFANNLDFEHIFEMSDVDNILDGINNTIVEALDKHSPLLTKTITVRHKQPWFTDDVKHQK